MQVSAVNTMKSVLVMVGQVVLMMALYHWVKIQRRVDVPYLGTMAVYLDPPILALAANGLVVVHLSRTGHSQQILPMAVLALCLTLIGFWLGFGLSVMRWGA
jgi:hypothetical protein